MLNLNRRFLTYAFQKIYIFSLKKDYRDFCKDFDNIQNVQHFKIKDALIKNSKSVFAQQHRFDLISNIRDFQNKVPISTYSEIEPYVKRIMNGELNVLTCEPIKLIQPTSGSTQASKYIPFTETYFKDIRLATAPWLYSLYHEYSALFQSKSYWSVSPQFTSKEYTLNGIPIGIQDDSEYLGYWGKLFSKFVFAVPTDLSMLKDFDEWQIQTCTHLLSEENLGFISVWSPTFLMALLRKMSSLWPHIRKNINDVKRRTYLDSVFSQKELFVSQVWPNLKLISCWGDGESEIYYEEIRREFPNCSFEKKGLMATEGVVSFPFYPVQKNILAYKTHFYEFLDVQNNSETQRPLLAHELKPGGEYSPILTTSSGLYRYQLRDIVLCEGFLKQVPYLSYKGKLDKVSDIAGEKLNASFVAKCVSEALKEFNYDFKFLMISPDRNQYPGYVLHVETHSSDEKCQTMLRLIESKLKENPHYQLCLNLGQIKPLIYKKIHNGLEKYYKWKSPHGERFGDIKPPLFETKSFLGE